MGFLGKLWEFLRKLWDCFFCWRVEPEKDETKLKSADIILALSFGDKSTVSNRMLAMVCEKFNQPAIFQWEVAWHLPPIMRASPRMTTIWNHRLKGKYLDTFEVLRQAWQICQRYGWKKAIIVAHPDHLWRAMKMAEKIGFEVMTADTSDVPYDELLSQWWTRGPVRFKVREIPTRLYCLLRGWV